MTDQNPGFPRTRRRNPYDGVGGWAAGSSRPPWGWPITLAITIPGVTTVVGLIAYGPALLTRLVGA